MRVGFSRKASMTYVITLYSVRAEAVGHFVRSVGRDGEWNSQSRAIASGLIATDLLQHETSASAPFLSPSSVLFVCLDFWMSRQAYVRACQSADCQNLFLQRRLMASSAFEFGPFSFPKRSDPMIAATSAEVWN
jgi:hypothetical protein